MKHHRPSDAMTQKSVGIWIRVSTEDQARGESPEHHEKRARAYAEAKDWKVREVYHLEAVSGKSVMAHPETQRMLAHVAEGRISGLIFSKLARLARNTRELLDFADLFRDHDADLVSLQESIDTSTPAGRLFYTMIAAMAQWEREEIADRVAASVPIRAKLGKRIGGAAPFGYQWKSNQLLPDPVEAPVRKLMYELFLEHRRKKTVARLLNEKGHRTRTGAKFSDTTIERLLRDPLGKGTRRANYTRSLGDKKHWALKPREEWVLSSVEPIISEETWAQCVAILDQRRETGRRPGRKPVHLFTGYAYCECGQKLYVPSNQPKYVCYRCRTKIGVSDLETVFQEQLRHFLLSPEDVAAHLSQADEEIKAKEERLVALTTEASRLRQEMDKTHRLYLNDELPSEGFGRIYKPLEERLRALETEEPKLQGELDFLKIRFLGRDELLAEAQDLYSRWNTLAPDEKRMIVEAIVQQIRVGKTDVEIDLAPLPASSETVALKQRNFSAALPFCPVRLKGARPRLFPKGYPHEPTTLGEQIRRRRLDLGLTQRILAKRLGCLEESVRAWEADEYVPLARRWPAIEGALGAGLVPRQEEGVGGRVRAERLRLGLTQQQLADRSGIHVRTVRNCETGRRPLSHATLARLRATMSSLA